MSAKRFCLLIASSLVLYAVVTALVKTNYIPFGQTRNFLRMQFIQHGMINSSEITRNANTKLEDASPSTRTYSQQLGNLQFRLKYNVSLSPDCYAITRPAESGNSISLAVDRKFISQHETAVEIASKLGKPVKRFPTTLIIGVRKAGTRALLAILRLHPQVKSCGPEVHYFDQRYPRGVQWYLEQTAKVRSEQQTIEKTPSYFVVRGVPERVLEYSKAINKTLKFLVIFRDPTIRAVSDYVQLNLGVQAKYNRVLKPFEKMVMKNNSAFEIDTSWGVVKTGVYSKHLERWLRYFPREWFHFVSGEELVRDPFQEIKKVEKFLEISPYFQKSNFVFNAQKGFPCFRGTENKNERCLGKTKGRAHPTVHPRILSELRSYYAPFNEQLYKMTGRNFQWP
ncbi:heparan sulfate glucosamine 3-O-sulfotransferase 5-like [Dendronephthya gigantea]|uniref:heparan sulfate glucosamine 3-O-sulfotransferase 5-like n=1 Tax=Dendronephthya gigantea TaxID=151771 RepID=UPI00106932A0|nr:heparan sulfate glucosamine 3-O-sulfotransferase 5-like [Dendronephthya gigantea]